MSEGGIIKNDKMPANFESAVCTRPPPSVYVTSILPNAQASGWAVSLAASDREEFCQLHSVCFHAMQLFAWLKSQPQYTACDTNKDSTTLKPNSHRFARSWLNPLRPRWATGCAFIRRQHTLLQAVSVADCSIVTKQRIS